LEEEEKTDREGERRNEDDRKPERAEKVF